MKMELVSVIIPIYNVEDYLDRCISSIVNQTYCHLEIILIDNGSTDRCVQICDEWATRDPRIRVIHQEKLGVSAGRNRGLRVASGEWVMQVDSDDYIATQTIEWLLRACREQEADMAMCDFIRGKEDAHVFAADYPEHIELIDGVAAISRIYTDSHHALRYAVACNRLCRRRLYDGLSYPEGKIFEDIYITHQLLYRCAKIAVLDIPLFYYYQRPGSIMNAEFSMKKLDYLQALVERVAFFKERGLQDLEQIAYDELLHSLIWEYSRTRDLLHSEEGMAYVARLFRQEYRRGYASKRYPKETKLFLTAFAHNPEWIIWYWRIESKLKHILKRNR